MMDVQDVAGRAQYNPRVYVPALVDEIQRLRSRLDLYESAFMEIQTLCADSGLWAVQNRIQKLNTELTSS